LARKTFLAFSCVHRPLHDEKACDWLVKEISNRQPDYIVNLGDMFDGACLSTFEKTGDESELMEEYESTGELLQKIKDARPRAKRVWMMGNHEQRMFRPFHAKLSGLIDYRKQIPEAKAWEHKPYVQHPDATFKLGQVSFYHGFSASVGACKSEAVKLGVPHGLTVSGHTHRPHPVHRISMGRTPLPYWMLNVGTLIGKCDYMATKDDSLWGQALAFGNVDPNVRHAGRQHWEAEMVLRKMLWDVGGAA
jgi:predicted phosphodiesterase